MGALKIEYQPTEYVIRIDKSRMSEIDFQNLVKWIETDILIKEVNFDDSIQTIGNDMKSHWWERNKHKFVAIEKND
ncbi:MAG: hypothetical protein U5N85_18335 [Arcicella sp.]|nr:hypothetical protein [Arcicella sp.]